MLETPSIPKPRESVLLWMYKIIAGFVIVALLGLHFIVNHLVAPNGLLTYQEVVNYYKNPLIPVLEIGFLTIVISHALVGLRGILLDLKPSDQLLKIIDILLWLVGVSFTVYGIWLIIVIAQR